MDFASASTLIFNNAATTKAASPSSGTGTGTGAGTGTGTGAGTVAGPRAAAGLPALSPSLPSYLASSALAHLLHLPDMSSTPTASSALSTTNQQQQQQQPLSPLVSPALASPTTALATNPTLTLTQTQSLPLPAAWNPKDKCGMLKLPHATRVEYDGPGRSDNDAAAVRANYPIPLATGIYYFECEIIAKGREGYIGIGFCAQGVPLNRLPGWEPLSWGYHGDDGNIFQSSGSGKPYGPTFQTGDVVGCGINFVTRSAFFTKNGVHLGTAFTNLPFPTTLPPSSSTSSIPAVTHKPIYPSVGMRTPGEILVVNFGHRPFRFDIDGYVREERRKVWDKVTSESASLPDTPSAALKPDALVKLVQGYLVHHGFKKTAEALMRQHQGGSASTHVHESDAMDVDQQTPPALTKKRSRDNLLKPKSIHDTVAEMDQRELIRSAILNGDIDAALQHLSTHYPSLLASDPSIQFDLECAKFIELVRACSSPSSPSAPTDPSALQPVIDYGRQTLFQWMQPSDPRAAAAAATLPHEYIQARLYELMPLIAYPNPLAVPAVAHLLDPHARQALADRVNAGIVVYALGMPARPALEGAVRQTRAAVATLAARGVGEASVLDWPAGVFGGL